MSSVVNKVKDAFTHHTDTNSTTAPTYGGKHDARSHVDSGPSDYTSTNDGLHKSSLANKMDPQVNSNRNTYASDNHGMSGTGSNVHSRTNPLSSNAYTSNTANNANKLDPTVDSNTGNPLGHNRNTTSTTGMGGNTHTGTNPMSGDSYNTNSHGNAPHKSNFMDKMDPTVDNNSYGRSAESNYGGHYSTSNNSRNVTGATNFSKGTSYDNPKSSNYGNHSTSIGNKMDPTIDSDRDGRARGAMGSSHMTGQSHLGGNNNMRNTGHGGYGAVTSGSGNAPTTSGPHDKDILNKLDPRVDSDLDGSRTMGNNQTFS